MKSAQIGKGRRKQIGGRRKCVEKDGAPEKKDVGAITADQKGIQLKNVTISIHLAQPRPLCCIKGNRKFVVILSALESNSNREKGQTRRKEIVLRINNNRVKSSTYWLTLYPLRQPDPTYSHIIV